MFACVQAICFAFSGVLHMKMKPVIVPFQTEEETKQINIFMVSLDTQIFMRSKF